MTDSFLDYAEEQFFSKDFVAAYRTAKTAQQLDPFFSGIDKYVAAYRVHAASLCKHEDGEANWYNILGIDCLSSTEVITHRFCKMGKLINPDNHCSAAAKGAYDLVSKAYQVLVDPEARAAFHKRWGFPPLPAYSAPIKSVSEKKKVLINRGRSCAASSNMFKRRGHSTCLI